MADMKGPVSKEGVAQGQTFNPKLKSSVGAMKSLSNSSDEAYRTIMSLRVSAGGSSFPTNIESAMTKAPRK